MVTPDVIENCNSAPLNSQVSAVSCELDQLNKKFGSGSLKILQDGYVDITMGSLTDNYSSPWTVECWFYPTAVGSSDGWLFNQDDNIDGSLAWYVRLKASSITLGIRGQSESSTVSIAYNEWHHLRVTHAGDKLLKLYLDGALLDSKTFATETDPRIRFGKPYTISDSDINRWYTGNIDEIAFTVLNSSNVAEYSGDTAPVPTEGYPDEGTSGGTGVVIDGLFLSTSKPKAGDKGLLVNNKFFIPFAKSSGGGGGEQQEPVLLSPTNVTEDTLASNTATNDYGTWSFSASNKAAGYEPSALFMESYDNFTFGIEPTHWLRMDCTNAFAPESLYFYGGGSSVLGYTPKTLEIYGISSGAEYLLGTATLVSTDTDRHGLSNTVEATIALNHGGRTYNSIKILQTSNQTGTSVQAIWRKIEIRGYDHAVSAPCSAEYYKCASVDTSAKTWSGYKAVFDSTAGTWSFSDTVTEGLSYIGITPVVNKIYSADTTIQVGNIKLDGILNDETVKFLLYPKLNGTLEDVSAGGNGVTVTNIGSVAVENNRIVFGEGKALIIPANTLPNDIFVSGSPFLIEFQGIIPAYTSKICCPWSRKEGSMYYDRFDMFLVTVEGDPNYGKISIPYLDENAPVGVFTVGAEHVVAVEYDGNNTGRVYLDGVMQYSFTGTRYLPFRTFDFYIGHDTNEIGGSTGRPFQGNMSYFRIRNVAPYQGASYTPEFV